MGIMAKPSTRMTTVFTAITMAPKLLVSDCTTMAAMEKIAWERPEGKPSFTRSFAKSIWGFRVWKFRSSTSFIRVRRRRHKKAETNWAIMVARATPETPMSNWATNRISSTIFSPQATIRNARGITASPMPRSIPAMIL